MVGDLLTNVEAAQAFINTNTTQIIKTVSWGARESHELSGVVDTLAMWLVK